jgi:predicted RNase H-like HicB family nuclease
MINLLISTRHLDLVMKKKFSVLVEKDEDGYYVASVPSLPGCHTQSKSLDELAERTREGQ